MNLLLFMRPVTPARSFSSFSRCLFSRAISFFTSNRPANLHECFHNKGTGRHLSASDLAPCSSMPYIQPAISLATPYTVSHKAGVQS